MKEKRNIRKYYLRYILYYCAYVLITGGIVQSFMMESGITANQVAIYTSIIQLVQAAAMLGLAPMVEKSKNIIRMNAYAQYGLVPLFIAMFALSLYQGMNTELKYWIMVGASVIGYVALAIIGIIEYKLPYLLMDIEHYGEVVSIAGLCIGLSNLAVSSLFSFLIERFDYFHVVLVFVLCGLFFLVASVFVGLSYEDISGEPGISQFAGKEAEEPTEKKKINLFRYPPFQKLFVPNLLRGYASGTFAILTTVGYYYGIINAKSASWMVIVSNIVIMGGCVLYARLSRLKKDGILILISSAAMLLLMPAMLIGKNTAVFILFYAVGILFKNIIDYACPVAITHIIDYDIVGQFSSWRIALYMLGAAIAGVVLMPMLDRFGGIVTMIINGVAFVIMGMGYWMCAREKS